MLVTQPATIPTAKFVPDLKTSLPQVPGHGQQSDGCAENHCITSTAITVSQRYKSNLAVHISQSGLQSAYEQFATTK